MFYFVFMYIYALEKDISIDNCTEIGQIEFVYGYKFKAKLNDGNQTS